MKNKVQVTSNPKSKYREDFIQGSSRLTGVTRTNLVFNSPVLYCGKMKQCSKCKQWKDESEFNFSNDRGRYRKECKKCYNKQRKEYYEKNRDQALKYAKNYRETHKEQRNKYIKHRKIKDFKYKLNLNISRAMRRSLKNGKNGYHWESYVDFTREDLVKHLEKQFTSGMIWGNYGEYWVIDHIIPISIFNFDNYSQLDFKMCWALENLRPLERTKNSKKCAQINEPFQPNLKI